METLGDRLRLAIDRCGSIRQFQKEMAGADARGHSNQMIYDYLMDRREPTLRFIRAAAKILGIRVAWLVAGEGPMTDLEKTVASGLSPLALQDRFGRDGYLYAGEANVLGLLPATANLLSDTVTMVLATARQHEDIDQELISAVAQDVFWLISLPRHLWGFRYAMDMRTTNDYYLAALLALRIAIAEPNTEMLDRYQATPIHELRKAFDPWQELRDALRDSAESGGE